MWVLIVDGIFDPLSATDRGCTSYRFLAVSFVNNDLILVDQPGFAKVMRLPNLYKISTKNRDSLAVLSDTPPKTPLNLVFKPNGLNTIISGDLAGEAM